MPVASEADVLEALRHYVLRLDSRLVESAISPDANMFDAGYIDSLSATELLSFVEQTYHVDVDADRLVTELSSLRALAALIAAEGARGS